ncbi:YeiH family protein [Paludibacterium yongneupense]|nr:YeiH family protein [Paludibacterium yongneupense]
MMNLLPGLALTLVLALGAAGLATLPWFAHYGVSALTLAIVGGMVLGNIGWPRVRCRDGVQFSKQRLLRLGIILYGLRLSLHDIASVGASGILIDAVTLGSTFALCCWVGTRWLRLDAASAILIGAGSSICGAAAVLATEPVARGGAEKVAVAVATVVVFGTLSMFLYPLLYPLQSLFDARQFGQYAGSTIHEVAQVVVAGRGVNAAATDVAVIAKMIRVMMLAPFLVGLSWWMGRRSGAVGGRKITIPWFALGFLLLATVNGALPLPASWRGALLTLDNLALAMAMAALGLGTEIAAIRRAGTRPLLLAGFAFCWLVLGGALINYGLGRWLG